MRLLLWAETDRETLARALPEAVVVLPTGATEQHGPHLPTGTDSLVVDALVQAAAARAVARAARDIVVTPAVPFGASDHHLPFGGTLSLTAETMTAVLLDLARSLAADGVKRLVIVNGHGGNRGPCDIAAAAASTRHELTVGYLDYWQVMPADAAEQVVVPGHAGAFETALVTVMRPELVGKLPERDSQPHMPRIPEVTVQSQTRWSAIQGFSDRPGDGDELAGKRWLKTLTDALADRLITLTESL